MIHKPDLEPRPSSMPFAETAPKLIEATQKAWARMLTEGVSHIYEGGGKFRAAVAKAPASSVTPWRGGVVAARRVAR